jgi:conjugal transfer pilus assembly protein TraW
MRFGKWNGSAVAAVALLASGVSISVAQDVLSNKEQARIELEEKLNAAKEKMQRQPQWFVPIEEQDKMREAMSGQGQYALPESDLADNPNMTDADKAEIRRQVENLDAIRQEMAAKGWFDEVQNTKKTEEYKRYTEVANQLVGETQNKLEKAFASHAGLDEKESALMAGRGDPTEKKITPTEHAVFVSFSMSHDALRNAFIRAKQQGAQVYFNGLHPNHRMINETMNLVRMIGQGIENPPTARFNPEAFDKYKVEQVPTILYRDGNKYAIASGILNLSWVKEELEKRGENADLGNYGPTTKVIERSIIEEMQERMAGIDWEAKQKRAVETYWQKRAFELLPRATEDKTWFIDPTVKAASDIKTPRDELLARKGQIINPLAGRSDNLVIVVFDAQDSEQTEWLTNHLKNNKVNGQLMLITTQIDKHDGWKHLERLMEQYRQRIYLLPKEMIQKFQLTGVPAQISTELDKDLLKISQFKI